MDSKVINKLIRSEILPILRANGFTRFNSRSAWRFQLPFICVVNFQSFNLSLAESLGCTTYSFSVRLGIFVQGGPEQRWVRKDEAGNLLPSEYQCEIRAELHKRTTVDGFPREDLFYIDPDGFTSAAVFREVKELIATQALPWFSVLADVDRLIGWLSAKQRPEGLLEINPGFIARMEDRSWIGLLTRLWLWQHAQSPSPQSEAASRDSINLFVSQSMDGLLPFYHDVFQLERDRQYIRSLFHSIPDLLPSSSALASPVWASSRRPHVATFAPPSEREVRTRVWQRLRDCGFSEFSNRLAHRAANDSVHTIAISYPTPLDRRREGVPPGLFHVGLGIFWYRLAENLIPMRANRAGEPRPKLSECHLVLWLVSRRDPPEPSALLFASVEEALQVLEEDGLPWLSLCDRADELASLLSQPDWQIFAQFPTMIGHGSSASVWRAMIRACLAHRCGNNNAVLEYLQSASSAVPQHFAPQQPRMQRWISVASPRLSPLE